MKESLFTNAINALCSRAVTAQREGLSEAGFRTSLNPYVAILLIGLCTLLFCITAQSQEPAGEGAKNLPQLVIATKEAPPFAMKETDGQWSGISISLWEALAKELDLEYRFEEASLADMIDGVADGRFAASIAATTITPTRESRVDFTHPFYSTGFGIALRPSDSSWFQMATRLLSIEFLKAVGLLSLLLSFVGLCFWLAERHRNPDEFDPRFVQGLGDGFWFSAVTMTTVGYGDMAPRTVTGRIVALVWMFTALLIFSTFTGMIASSLTADRMRNEIHNLADLPNVRTSSVSGSAADEWLTNQGLGFDGLANTTEGLNALASGTTDAFVYDRPLLQHLIREGYDGTLQLVPTVFGRQDYGIALPQGSPMREPMNRALLRYLASDAWNGLLLKYLSKPY